MPLIWTHHPEFVEACGLDDVHLASDGEARFVITRDSIDGHFPGNHFWLYVYQTAEDMQGKHGEYICEEFETVDQCKHVAEEYADELRTGPMQDGKEDGDA